MTSGIYYKENKKNTQQKKRKKKKLCLCATNMDVYLVLAKLLMEPCD